jgi:hypothetical protein
LFPKLKKELVGYTMTRGEFKKEREGVLTGAGREEFAKAFVWWYEWCKISVHLNGSYVKK